MARTELFARKQAGGMFSVVNQSLTTGNIFFVNSVTGTDAAGYGQNPDAPVRHDRLCGRAQARRIRATASM
jgi:hypothetical protein